MHPSKVYLSPIHNILDLGGIEEMYSRVPG